MYGLVIKDSLSYLYKQKLIPTILNYVMFIGILFIPNGYGLQLIALLASPIACSALPTTLFEMDGKSNFDRYAIAMPFTKADIVKSRYLSSLVYAGKTGLEMIVFCIFEFILHQSMHVDAYVQLVLWCICLCILFMAFANVSNYIMGINGGAIMMLLMMILAFGVYLVVMLLDINLMDFVSLDPWVLLGIAAIAIGCLYYLSYRISLYVYKRHHA